jgi:ADP-ribosylglycohydrolase
MKLNQDDYRDKVLGCWLGKNVGGTLGAPFEWRRQINDVSFYTQKNLNGQPMPNDDLDIQLLWLCALEEKGLDVTAHRLAEYWCLYVTPHWCEYGTAKINMRQGLQPPLSGTFHNAYKHSCGSYIRSEIWACIAPGLPHIAARYAYEDAILDHGNGEGVYAEVFMSALESAAFVVSDLRRLIDIGLSYIPADCGVAKAVHTTLACFDSGTPWKETRHEVLRLHRGGTFWGNMSCTSAEDTARGFTEGTPGYDVPSNIAITLIGLLYGSEDFAQGQCIAVNCGEDTDCTAATAGSIWGIIHGARAIPQKWIDPIGRGIKTVCLNFGELGYFGDQIPQTVDELTDRTIRIGRRMLARHRAEHFCSTEPTSLEDAKTWNPKASDDGRSIWGGFNGPRFDFDFFNIYLDYGMDGPVIRDGQPKSLTVTIENRYKIQANLSLHWYLPESGWKVSPSADGYVLSLPGHLGKASSLTFTFTAERLTCATNRAVLEITIEGRPTVMLVPITLLNGNLLGAS